MALDRWYKGDPLGFVEIASNDITYFDPHLEQKLCGKEDFTKLMESIKGMVHADGYEWVNPRVEHNDSMAVLSFNLVTGGGEMMSRWNSTEVYRLEKDGVWRIIHSHWSVTKPTFAK